MFRPPSQAHVGTGFIHFFLLTSPHSKLILSFTWFRTASGFVMNSIYRDFTNVHGRGPMVHSPSPAAAAAYHANPTSTHIRTHMHALYNIVGASYSGFFTNFTSNMNLRSGAFVRHTGIARRSRGRTTARHNHPTHTW